MNVNSRFMRPKVLDDLQAEQDIVRNFLEINDAESQEKQVGMDSDGEEEIMGESEDFRDCSQGEFEYSFDFVSQTDVSLSGSSEDSRSPEAGSQEQAQAQAQASFQR